MARFYPIYARRSDGKTEVLGKGKRMESNQPTDEQMDQKPDKNGVSDYYREVPADETKHLDWRRKLGGMLARELQWKDKSGNGGGCMNDYYESAFAYGVRESGYILATFPENYRLYEHIKKTEKDGKTEVKSKTHAAGGNDRQDAYLYGHPIGRRKRYRSPADFFPHLLWLCTDEAGDPDNCSCKICCPEELEDILPGVKTVKTEKPAVEVKPANSPVPFPSNAQAPPVKRPSVVVKAAPDGPMPTTLSQPRSMDQRIDSQYKTFMYRPGELVWFKRGQAWGLGVVLRRWQTGQIRCHYTVQPLSHPFQHSTAVTKSEASEMRPWLAWSVPRFTYAGLNDLPNPPRYETADWQGIASKRYGDGGDMEVDGSIMAAKTIDASYTPFQLNRTVQPEPGVTETYYNGIYLGAEKMWLGDAVRLFAGSGQDVMVIHAIVERHRAGMTQQTMNIVGDIYTLVTVAHGNPAIPTLASPNNNPQLPQRITQDLVTRNAQSIHLRQQASYWKLVSAQSRLDLDMIKGRWYELSIIMPILQPEAFENMMSKGEFQEASLWMNSRGDCHNANRSQALPRLPKTNIRRSTRLEALGRAVPHGTEIKDGIDPPMSTNVDPALNDVQSSQAFEINPSFETAQDVGHGVGGQGGHDDMGDAGLDQFMNLDDIDTHADMPGFGQDYASQASNHGGFY